MTVAERTAVARVVFPVADVDAVLPLYVDGDASHAELLGRDGVRVLPGGTVSLGSYFNAFPASYWRAETDVTTVRLTARLTGRGRIEVFRSDAQASAVLVESREVDGVAGVEVELPLDGFADGGVLWFDLIAADGETLELSDADWSIAGAMTASATAVMATFNRPVDCLAQLRTIVEDARLDDLVDRVVVVDQGTDLVAGQPDFAAVAARLGDRLQLVRQPNLGGSGGFSRGMLEALRAGDSDYVLLLDDDAITEPEAVARAIRFAAAAREPLVVGGGMLHLDDRAVLYTQSEQWDPRIGWVRLDRPGAYDHDFAATPFRDAPYFHAHQRSDFNGWWMCLIPIPVIREAGLSLPLFLKGDDVEFALRAREHGVRTVSPTGIALWHLGWGGKAPTRTWEAYFLHRNRLITELLHARRRRPTGVILHSFLGDLKPLLTLQYSAVRLRAQAIVDVLSGPERLPRWLGTRASAIRDLWQEYPDATPVTGLIAPEGGADEPRGRIAQVRTLLRVGARHLLVPARPFAADRPEVHLTASRLGWWSFADVDSALVDTADGRAMVRYRRDRRESVRALRRSMRLHARLWLHWPWLATGWRRAAPRLASAVSWAEVLGP
ncbi:MAG: glycosyltransferase [Microbacterium sp.]|uniref:glycosyltransferase n=1 Tax=Microbacterium sp. TaxID=51671 RepID=UPI0039E3A7E4